LARSTARTLGLLLVAATLASAPGTARAKRWFVPRQHRTIQKAIDAASPGDTIWVAAGTYRGTITLKKRLVLFGDGGAEKTILDGKDSMRVVHVEGVNQAAITGFTIRGGKANSGGGIHCVRDSAFAIGNCIFTGNWESAISIWDGQGVTIGNCTFRGNKGSAVVANRSIIAIFESQFFDNEGRQGAAVSLSHVRLIVPFRNLVFERNRVRGATGGAICAEDSTTGTILNTAFRENESDVAGGAIAVMSGSTINISRTIFEKNRAAAGGALQSDRARVNVGMSLFRENAADAFGGAIGIAGRTVDNVAPTFANNTFVNNTVKGDGATLFFSDASPNVRKNILVVDRGQRAVMGMQSSPRYDCNLVWDPSGGASSALPSVNTWFGDPLFCDAEHGNFALRDLSPAIRAPCGPIGAFIEKAGCSSFRLQPAN